MLLKKFDVGGNFKKMIDHKYVTELDVIVVRSNVRVVLPMETYRERSKCVIEKRVPIIDYDFATREFLSGTP